MVAAIIPFSSSFTLTDGLDFVNELSKLRNLLDNAFGTLHLVSLPGH